MDEIILKQYESEVKAVEGERALNVTITTNDVDRSGDIVEPKGAKLTNFKKNPVVLMAHDYQGLPIGRATDLVKTDTGITAKVIFPEEGTYPLADTVYNMYKQKFMKAWSIGFIPIKSEEINVDDDEDKKGFFGGGRRYKTWELLEFSACSVPNNPGVTTDMISKGIDTELLKEAGFITIVEADKKYNCECIECSHKMKSDKHCKDLKCPECGGTMRRVERPGPGEDAKDAEDVKAIIKDKVKDVKADPIDPDKVMASIEKDEEEDKIEININENDINITSKTAIIIYEMVKENKELKEKIKELEIKAGAVLNAKNKSNLKNAQSLIQSVLDSAGEEEGQEGEEEKDTKKDDTVITLTADKKEDPGKVEVKKEKTITVNETVIAAAINKAMKFQLGITEK